MKVITILSIIILCVSCVSPVAINTIKITDKHTSGSVARERCVRTLSNIDSMPKKMSLSVLIIDGKKEIPFTSKVGARLTGPASLKQLEAVIGRKLVKEYSKTIEIDPSTVFAPSMNIPAKTTYRLWLGANLTITKYNYTMDNSHGVLTITTMTDNPAIAVSDKNRNPFKLKKLR